MCNTIRMYLIRVPMLLVLCGASPLTASEPVSVDQLVEWAIRRHPELLALEADLEAARAAKAQAGIWQNPEFSGDIGQKTIRDSGDDGLVYSVGLAQTFEYPGKSATRKAIAEKQIELAGEGLSVFKRTLEADVRSLAAEWLVHRDLIEIVRGLVDATGSALDDYLKRRPAGAQQTIEQKLVEGAILDMNRVLLEAERDASGSLAALNQLLGRPDSEPLNLEMKDVIGISTDWSSVTLSNHPLARLRAMELDQSRLLAEEIRLNGRPDLTAGPYYNEESAGEDEYTVGLVFSISLPLWNRARGDMARAQAEQEKALSVLRQTDREVQAEWNRHRRDAGHYQALLDQFTRERIESMRSAAELAAQQFMVGAVSAPLFLDMQREFLSAAVTRHEALGGITRATSALYALYQVGEE